MRLSLAELPSALGRDLKRWYLVAGDEPLLINEAADAIRAAARAAGFTEREVFFVEKGFDWDALRTALMSPSLFAERRIIELRLPSGKPDKGAPLLAEVASHAPPDVLGLVISGKLDRKASEAAWVRSIEREGCFVPVWPVERAALPAWLMQRARALKLKLEPRAAELIVERVEGNLLAAQQELEKLALLSADGTIPVERALSSVADSARYDVFQLAEAAGEGDLARALRVLLGLKSEGIEPTLILWALVRELRGLAQARGGGAGLPWNLASRPSARALARAAQLPVAALIAQAARTDRIVKGIERGDAWSALTGLTAALAGALQGAGESGRVAV
ncbi:MAG TPA: DNA polymerase III subunit delta [Steroidobacteraceae bacterium]|nr:DNA polymerase III subunit delta [Steroidobacteraceae bacterium]